MTHNKHFLNWLDDLFENADPEKNLTAKQIEILYRLDYPRSAKTYGQITCILPRYDKVDRAEFKDGVFTWNLKTRIAHPLPPFRKGESDEYE